MEESKKEELQNILNQIENLYYVDNIEDRKDELLNLWTRYYQLAYSYHIQLDSVYNLFLLGENVCYVIDSKLNRQENMEVPNDAIYHLLEVLKENKDSLVNGISSWYHGVFTIRSCPASSCPEAPFTIYPTQSIRRILTSTSWFRRITAASFGTNLGSVVIIVLPAAD